MPDVMVKVGVFADAIQVISKQFAVAIFTVTTLPVAMNELASKITLSLLPGTSVCPEPPDVSDQCAASLQFPLLVVPFETQ